MQKTIAEINHYTSFTVNPLSLPEQTYELYSVPSYDSGLPEIIQGKEIGSTKVAVRENDVLVCKINPRINRVWVVKHHTQHPLIASSEWIVIRSPENDCEYLKWYFMSPKFHRMMVSQVTGIGGSLTRAQPKQVATYPVPIPDLPTQRRIAATLDKVSEGIALCKQMLADLDELVKSQFVEMFGAIDSNEKGWLKEPLLKHAEVLVGYPFPSTGYAEEGIKIVGGYNLMQGYINWEDSKHWPDPTGYEQYLLKEGDIVMAMDRPWTGDGFKMAFIEGNKLPSILIQRTACIRSKDLSNEFLYAMLNSTWFAEHCDVKGSLVPHISNKDINSFSIFIPPVELQREYAAFYQQADKSKFAVQQQLMELEMLKESLMQEYFG